MSPQRWEHLTLRGVYHQSTGYRTWSNSHDEIYGVPEPDAITTVPMQFINDVLGPDGWELTTIEELARGQFTGDNIRVVGRLIDTQYWFKRPVEG